VRSGKEREYYRLYHPAYHRTRVYQHSGFSRIPNRTIRDFANQSPIVPLFTSQSSSHDPRSSQKKTGYVLFLCNRYETDLKDLVVLDIEYWQELAAIINFPIRGVFHFTCRADLVFMETGLMWMPWEPRRN
jgi:hypothetical protein